MLELPSTDWLSKLKHIEKVLEGSDGENPAPVQRAYELNMNMGSGGLFGASSSDSLKKQHPKPLQIFKLWQIFLTNVHPLLMIFHAPSVQERIIEASEDLAEVPDSTEALMFAIYGCAVGSLDDSECEGLFKEDRISIMNDWQRATEQALNSAHMVRTLDIQVLQAFVLLLINALQTWHKVGFAKPSRIMRTSFDPRSLWIHTGIAVRIAQRIGLHRESNLVGLPYFESEMRRRLWWQILLLDTRTSELSGAETSILNDRWDVKIPRNLNDSTLNPDMGEPPIEQTGLSDMVFPLIRYEVANFLRQRNATFLYAGHWRLENSQNVSLEYKDQTINDLVQLLETKYLRFCDPMVPLHVLASKSVNIAINRMRFTAHHPRQLADQGANMDQEEKENLFDVCLQQVESDNLLHAAKGMEKYMWFININFQLPALIYLLSEIRRRPHDQNADRAWSIMNEAFSNRQKPPDHRRKSPLFRAVGALVTKAWQHREAELARRGETAPVPEYIRMIREVTSKLKPSANDEHQNGNRVIPTSDPVALEKDKPDIAGQKPLPDFESSGNEPGTVPASNEMNTVDWSPMDWNYWDELVATWDTQMGGDDQFTFNQ
ncbi:MAG: hypothetical protein Q9190_001677 [Brigantiaea leucoxantha]